jgi:tetratricopeptide (TPR) repeat protein
MKRWMWLTLAAVVVAAAGVTLVALPKEQEWTTVSPEALAAFAAGVDAQMKLYEDDAARHFERALELDPDFVIANMFSLSHVPHDNSEVREARWAKIEEADTSKLTPRERFFVERRIAYHEERSDDAEALLEECVAKYPNDPYIFNQKALYAWHSGRMEEAEKLYQRLVEMSPNWVIAYNQLGYINMGKGRFTEAEESFKSYRFIAPDQANPHDSLGELFITLGRYDEAEETLERAIEIKPDFWASYAHLALLKGLSGDLEGAREVVTRTEQAGGPQKWLTEMDCGQRYMAMRNAEHWQEILDLAETECATDWKNGFATVTTHFAASQLGNWEKALALEVETANMLEKVEQGSEARKVMTLRGAFAHMQGVRLASQGDYAEAEKQLRIADKEFTYIEAGTATYKLYNRMILAEVLLADNQDAEAHGLLSEVRRVNPLMIAEFEETGLKMLGLDRG